MPRRTLQGKARQPLPRLLWCKMLACAIMWIAIFMGLMIGDTRTYLERQTLCFLGGVPR